MDAEHETIACQRFFDSLTELCVVRSVKLYRFRLDPVPRVPVLPCLDHEAMSSENIPRHAAAYVEDRSSRDIHEILFVPSESLIELDVVSAADEHSVRSRERLMAWLKERFPSHTVRASTPSAFRGDRRVMQACRAQVSLREILHGDDFDRLDGALEKLRTIAALMEKESRVASWGLQIAAVPLVALAAFLVFAVVGFAPGLGTVAARAIQGVIVLLATGVFVYLGVRAVHLTEVANRVWKRATEYGLIVSERRRLSSRPWDLDTSVGAVPAGIIRTDRS
ncbi:MAG: hypothetical protein FJW23_06715 [Acidimicrobiia bacterium]|nr:hypothetical protein [Acidimicrobiia bacterium]